MIWLLLDAGNSTLKWMLTAGAAGEAPLGLEMPDVLVHGMLAIEDPALDATLAAELSRAFPHGSKSAGASVPSAAWGCAVAGADRIEAIEHAVRKTELPAVHWFGAAAQFDHRGVQLRNGYRDPAQLGSDRWHALIGARARFAHGPLIVVNAGTATTVDAIDEHGRFVGGVIAPGVELMRASLARGTARLPLATGNYRHHPDNTDDAIRTGILDAQIGLIAQRVQRLSDLAGGDVQTVLSGGNAALLHALLQAQARLGKMALEPDLVLLGLWHRARAQNIEALANGTG